MNYQIGLLQIGHCCIEITKYTMFNTQANSARFIYTISSIKPSERKEYKEHVPVCHLRNGFYFTKETRSDEKVRYTELDMESVVRTIMFMYVFEISADECLNEIINSGEVSYTYDDRLVKLKNKINTQILIDLMDSLFGEDFSMITSRVMAKCLHEYNAVWRKLPFRNSVRLPSALDYLKLSRFVNASLSCYTNPTQFILDNKTDHKIKLQNNIKKLY